MPRLSASGIQVEGLRQAVRDLERVGAAVEDLKDVFTSIAADVADEAHDRLRSEGVGKSGALDKSIRPAKAKNKAVVRAGSAKAWYAAVVEKDKRGHRGAGFLTTPANSNIDARVERIVQGLNDIAAQFTNRSI